MAEWQTRWIQNRVALLHARIALVTAGTALQQEATDVGVCNQALGAPVTSTVPVGQAPLQQGAATTYSRNLGEFFAATFVDSYELVRETAGEVQEEMLAVADAQAAERSDESRAALYTQTGSLISRAALAGVLAGSEGRDSVFATPGRTTAAPICRTERGVDPGIAGALGILRSAAFPPDALAAINPATGAPSFSFDDLMVGSVPEGPLRDRIFETTGYVPPTLITSSDALFRTLSVSRSDMMRAREIMVEEHRAFARSDSYSTLNRIDSQIGPGRTTLTYARYASTSLAPSQPPVAYWPTVAREVPASTVWQQFFSLSEDRAVSTGDALFVPNVTYADRNTANLLDWAYAVAYDAVSKPATGSVGWPASYPFNSFDPVPILRAHLMAASTDHLGRAEVCYRNKDNNNNRQYQVRLHTDTQAPVIAVRGVEGLRCAVTGYIEGRRCLMSEYATAVSPVACTSSGASAPPTAAQGFTQCLQWGTVSAGMEGISGTRWYFVTPVGDRGTLATGAACSFGSQCLSGGCNNGVCSGSSGTGGPGSYRAIGGVTFPAATGGPQAAAGAWNFCDVSPFVASVDDMVRQALERDPDDCTEAATSCSGLSVNHLLPLENELISNSNQYEDSWRHYLDLAAQASAHADELADTIVNNGIYVDERQERAADDLERLCGASVSLDGIFDTSGSTAFTTTSCTATSTCVTAHGAQFRCFAGKCQRDPVLAIQNEAVSNSERARINECLGDSSIVPAVNLGTTPVCFWRRKNNPAAVCETDSGGTWDDNRSCPFAATESSSGWFCDPSAVPGMPTSGIAGFELVVTQPLGLFDPDVAPDGARPPNCQDIRDLRDQRLTSPEARSAAFDRIVASGYLTPQRVRSIARRLGWSAAPGDYSAVTYEGAPWIRNGDLQTGAASTWPCTASATAQCAGGTSASLWCSTSSCATAGDGSHPRRAFNARLFRAVTALQSTSGAGQANLLVPYWPSGGDYNWGIRAQSYSTSPALGGLGILWQRNGRELRYRQTGTASLPIISSADEISGPTSMFCLVQSGAEPIWTGVTSVGASNPLFAACDVPAFSDVFIQTQLALVPITRESTPEEHYDSEVLWSGLATPTIVTNSRPELQPRIFMLLAQLRDGVAVSEGTSERRTLQGDLGVSRFANTLAIETHAIATIRDAIAMENDSPDSFDEFWNDPLRAIAAVPELGGNSIVNLAYPVPNTPTAHLLRSGDLLDAAELVCEAATAFDENCSVTTPPSVNSADDLPAARGFLRCLAGQIEARSANLVLSNMPTVTANVVRESQTRGTFPSAGGEFGANAASLASQLVLYRNSSRAFAGELRELESDIRRIETALRVDEVRGSRADLNLAANIGGSISGCVSSLIGGAFIGGIAGCANSIATISIASQLNDLEETEVNLAENQRFDEFLSSFANRSEALRGIATSIDSSYHQINSLLAQSDTSRRQARGALARAIGADSDAMGRQYALTTALRRRHSTNVVRYQEALLNARRLAYLARRSIEQRFGIDLRELDRDLGLVEPPREWIDRVCTMTGIDYNRIRSGTTPMTTYADGYIGDYVRRLELLVEGYRLAYPFHDADDTTVLSMRDEILNVRDDCELVADGAEGTTGLPRCSVAPRNLLPHGENLAAFGEGAWDYASCTTLGSGMVENCIAVSDLPVGTRGPNVAPIIPFTDGGAPDGTVGAVGTTADEERAFELRFGGPSGVAGTSLAANSRVSQTLTLPVGRYRVSWYGRSTGTLDPKDVLYVNGAQVTTASTGWAVTSATAGWNRYWYVFDVTSASGSEADVEIGFGHGPTVSVKTVQLSSLMLESVSGTTPLGGVLTGAPGAFMPSGYGTGMVLPYAEDTDGDRFRQRWRRDCVRLCPGGFSSCDTSATEPYCFYETQFAVSEESIEQGRIIRPGGFALGNFNYRFNSVALNFVGTGARTCEDDTRPSSCYSSAYIPYSLYHDGPFTVRNHVGGSYYAPVTPGRLEHGRGLAAERYISNPMSSADQSLLSQYTHSEWRGRPLTGRYTVRVWDVEGVNFQGIEDVQVVLGYHYWTRAE